MSKFTVVTPKGASFTVAGGGYAYEKEALDQIGAEIVEAPANEAEFIAAARDADAIYAKGMPITKAIIDRSQNCKVITLGSVGVDIGRRQGGDRARHSGHQRPRHLHRGSRRPRHDAAAVPASAGWSSRTRWCARAAGREGRPALLKIPRLMGQTLGFISFGRVARAVAKRAAPFGLRMMAYDPFIQETLMSDHGVIPATLVRSAVAVRLRLDACAGAARGAPHARREALQADEEDRDLHQYRPRRRPWTRKR